MENFHEKAHTQRFQLAGMIFRRKVVEHMINCELRKLIQYVVLLSEQ